MVAVVKRTLMGLKLQDSNVERFRMLLAVAAGIINRRPITRVSVDPEDMEPLTFPLSSGNLGAASLWLRPADDAD